MRRGWLVAYAFASGCSGGHGGGGGGDAPGSGSNAPLVACVTETNRFRTTVPPPGTGAPRAAVTESAQLEAYAATGAMYDFTNGPHAHFTATQGGGIAFAENECPVQGMWMLPAGGDMSTLVVQCVDAFYAEGPGGGHYDNMMGNYGTLGCGIYQMGTGVTIVQDYGM